MAAGIALVISVATALPAAAGTSGSESVQGVIVASGVSGTRNPDGSCAVGQPLLYEVDMVAFSGTLSF